MPQPVYLSKITLPITVNDEVVYVEYTIKDAEARQLIEDIGHAIYWIGVTTTQISDGDTTNPIVVSNESVMAKIGGMASYLGSEFVWNGSTWQEMGKNNFGALAFKSSAEGQYTPTGIVTVDNGTDATETVTPFGTTGTLPTSTWTVSGETAVYAFTPGTLPTPGTDVTVVTSSGTRTATFTGTPATIQVE